MPDRDVHHRDGGVIVEAGLAVLPFQEVEPMAGVGLVQVAIAAWISP